MLGWFKKGHKKEYSFEDTFVVKEGDIFHITLGECESNYFARTRFYIKDVKYPNLVIIKSCMEDKQEFVIERGIPSKTPTACLGTKVIIGIFTEEGEMRMKIKGTSEAPINVNHIQAVV